MDKPTFDRKRPLSWSAISSFEYDPEQWYRKYVLKEEQETSAPMEFGKVIGERLASDPAFLPHIPRYPEFERKLECKLGKIPLIGFIDSYRPHDGLLEYKTGQKAWDQKRADGHGQIDMYLLMLYLSHHVRPENVACTLSWIPTKENGDFSIGFVNEDLAHSFHTKRSMAQILRFGDRINRVYKEMEEYAAHYL